MELHRKVSISVWLMVWLFVEMECLLAQPSWMVKVTEFSVIAATLLRAIFVNASHYN